MASELRAQGNASFRSGDFIRAEQLYTAAARDALENGVPAELALALGNRASARLQLGKPSQALDDCNEALASHPCVWKLLMRKMTALEQLLKFDQAHNVACELVRQLRDPKLCNAATAQSLQRVQRKRDELNVQRQNYRPPPLHEMEKRALFSKNHTLRVYLQDTDLASSALESVPTGKSSWNIQLYIGNEFGLFVETNLERNPSLAASLVELDGTVAGSCAIARGVFSEHGRLTTAIELDIPTSQQKKLLQLRLSTDQPDIVPVLTLPFNVGPSSRLFYHDFGVQFTCCRELRFAVGVNSPLAVRMFEASGSLGIAGKLWDGGAVLLKYLASQPHDQRASFRVVELGAGTGALGIGCCGLGFGHVVITDLEEVLGQIRANVALNERIGLLRNDQARVADCTWGRTAPDGAFDLILFADCVYDPDFYEDLISALLSLAERSQSARVLWAHRHRNPEDYRFFQQMHEHFSSRLIQGLGPRFLVPEPDEELVALAVAFGADSERVAEAVSGPIRDSADVSVYESVLRVSG